MSHPLLLVLYIGLSVSHCKNNNFKLARKLSTPRHVVEFILATT